MVKRRRGWQRWCHANLTRIEVSNEGTHKFLNQDLVTRRWWNVPCYWQEQLRTKSRWTTELSLKQQKERGQPTCSRRTSNRQPRQWTRTDQKKTRRTMLTSRVSNQDIHIQWGCATTPKTRGPPWLNSGDVNVVVRVFFCPVCVLCLGCLFKDVFREMNFSCVWRFVLSCPVSPFFRVKNVSS